MCFLKPGQVTRRCWRRCSADQRLAVAADRRATLRLWTTDAADRSTLMTAPLAALRDAVRAAADSPHRFADGGQYRIEIPSVEGPAAFEAVLAAAQEFSVPVHRISQGSGITLLRDVEITAMAQLGADRGIEVRSEERRVGKECRSRGWACQ